jgi:RND family efflux transporter MFP subunit
VRDAELNLEFTQITAPVGGRISRHEVSVGNLVVGGSSAASTTLLTTIVSLDPIYFYFDMSEADYLAYQRAAASGKIRSTRDGKVPVYVKLTDEKDWPREGRLDFVDNQVDPGTGTIRTRAVFSNRSRALTPGLFARVKLVGNQKSKALLVRDAAIGTDQDRKFVLVVGPGDTLAYRPIVPGRLTDGLRIVTSGVQAGDRVVVNGLMRVRPGMKVVPTVTAMAQDSATPAGER